MWNSYAFYESKDEKITCKGCSCKSPKVGSSFLIHFDFKISVFPSSFQGFLLH
jgi:hypothetical protein